MQGKATFPLCDPHMCSQFVDMEGCAQSACATSADHRDAVLRFLDRQPARYDWSRMASEHDVQARKEST